MVRYASHRANVISGRLDCLIANPNLKRQESRVCGNSPYVWLWTRSHPGLRYTVKNVGVTALACPGCREALRWLDDVTSGWRGCYCCRSGVVTAYVTSLETTARLFPAVCAACQLSLVRSNAWHLTAQLLVPAKLLRATVWHVLLVTEPRRKSWFETLASEYTKSMWSWWYTLSAVWFACLVTPDDPTWISVRLISSASLLAVVWRRSRVCRLFTT